VKAIAGQEFKLRKDSMYSWGENYVILLTAMLEVYLLQQCSAS